MINFNGNTAIKLQFELLITQCETNACYSLLTLYNMNNYAISTLVITQLYLSLRSVNVLVLGYHKTCSSMFFKSSLTSGPAIVLKLRGFTSASSSQPIGFRRALILLLCCLSHCVQSCVVFSIHWTKPQHTQHLLDTRNHLPPRRCKFKYKTFKKLAFSCKVYFERAGSVFAYISIELNWFIFFSFNKFWRSEVLFLTLIT